MTVLSFSIFIAISFYFCFSLKECTYLGIRAQQINEQWQVKKIQYDGLANHYDIFKGDVILKINNEDVRNNKQLNRWLIIENVNSITLRREQQEKQIVFEKNNTIMQKFLVFFAVGFIGFLFLFHFIKTQNGGRSGWYFYSFLSLILFSLSAVVPSSIGNPLGRLMIVIFISLFPFYLELFLHKTNNNSLKPKKNILSMIFLGIAIINILLCLMMNGVELPNLIAEYLAQGIFSVLGVMLLLVLFKNLFFKHNNEDISNSKIDLSLIGFLSFIPLMLCYIFPLKWEVPFYLVIPFTLIPVIGILHSLMLSKLVSYRYKFKNKSIYFIIAAIISIVLTLFLFLDKYLPNYILIIYGFFLIFSLLPYIDETLVTMKKQKFHTSSLSLFSAVENERENVSTYIHDSIIQDVIYSMRTIESGGEMIPKNEVVQVLDEVVFYLRELCSDIYPLMIQEIGLKNTLISSINELQKKYPIIISYDIYATDLNFSSQKSNFILRSIRELMNNSILHGNATQIWLEIVEKESFCTIRVKDNGKFEEIKEENADAHFGLDIIKEKLILLNGEITINYEEETLVEIKIPFDEIGAK